MRVFLTGGTGLLGRHVAQLLRDRGDEVVALHRAKSHTAFLESSGCRLVQGDLQDEAESLAALMAGCSHLVHSAALVYSGLAWPEVRAVNVRGTRSVFEAAGRAGVGVAVHISSVAVYGSVRGPVDETAPTDDPVPESDLYARSKRDAEAEASSMAQESGLSLTILRPAALYGEGDRFTAPRLARMVRRRITPLLGSGDNTLPMVYAGNAAAAVLRALDSGGDGRVYDVGLDGPVTQRQTLAALARGLGEDPTFLSLPVAPVRWAAAALESLGVSAPGGAGMSLTRAVQLASENNPYPSRAIRKELGWDPPHEPHDALERTGRWLATHEGESI